MAFDMRKYANDLLRSVAKAQAGPLCERCEDKGRERPATYIEGSWCLCADCRDAVAEQQHEDRIADYYGASTPQTIDEQYQAAARQKRELDR